MGQAAGAAAALASTGQVVDYGLLAAGIVMTLLPVYLVYAFMQRRMREALVTGAVKG